LKPTGFTLSLRNFFTFEKQQMRNKQETLIIASDQMKAHFPHTIVKNSDFHRKFTHLHVGSKILLDLKIQRIFTFGDLKCH
jgi:hypothetical protein